MPRQASLKRCRKSVVCAPVRSGVGLDDAGRPVHVAEGVDQLAADRAFCAAIARAACLSGGTPTSGSAGFGFQFHVQHVAGRRDDAGGRPRQAEQLAIGAAAELPLHHVVAGQLVEDLAARRRPPAATASGRTDAAPPPRSGRCAAPAHRCCRRDRDRRPASAGNRSATDSRSAAAGSATAPRSSPARGRHSAAPANGRRDTWRWSAHRPPRRPRRWPSRRRGNRVEVHLPEVEIAPFGRQPALLLAGGDQPRARLGLALDARRAAFKAAAGQPPQRARTDRRSPFPAHLDFGGWNGSS